MLSDIADMFDFFNIIRQIAAITAGAFLSAQFSRLKTLAIKFQAPCLLAYATCFLLLLGSPEAFRSFYWYIFVRLLLIGVMQVLNGHLLREIGAWRMDIYVVDRLDGGKVGLGDNEPHFMREASLFFGQIGDVLKGGDKVIGIILHILLLSQRFIIINCNNQPKSTLNTKLNTVNMNIQITVFCGIKLPAFDPTRRNCRPSSTHALDFGDFQGCQSASSYLAYSSLLPFSPLTNYFSCRRLPPTMLHL